MNQSNTTPVQDDKSQILNDQLALVSVNIGIFAGYRRATRETIKALGGSIPDCSAITEGSIKVFPNEALKEFSTIRRGLFRTIASRGVRAMGSGNVFAIPKDGLGDIEAEITTAKAKFEAEVVQLDGDYEKLFAQHVTNNGIAASIIESLKVPKAEALAKMHFGTSIFRILPVVREGDEEAAAEGVESIVAGLARRLFEEVAEVMVETAESDAFTVKQRAGQKSLRPIKAAVQKMRGLEFLEPRLINGAIGLVGDVLSTLPKEGYIQDQGMEQPFTRLRKLVETMGDPDQLVNAASRFANGLSAAEILFPAPVIPVVAAPEVEEPVAVVETEQVTAPVETPVVTPAPVVRPIPAMAARPGTPLPKMPFLPNLPRVRPTAWLI